VLSGQAYFWWNVDFDAFGPPYSLECIFWQQTYAPGTGDLVAMQSSTSVAVMFVNASRHLQMSSSGSTFAQSGTTSIQAWHHAVMTSSNTGALLLYLDAVQVASGSSTAMPTGNYRFAVGGATANQGSQFYGGISEVAIYPTALSPTQINNHFLAIDNVPSNPVWRIPSSANNYPTSGTSPIVDLSSLVQYVSKIFQNSP
jgi:Concanavalin A-like lectin/glucanases superfamily